MLKISPKENRSMFIASLFAISGIAGGLAAIVAGTFLKSISGMEFNLFNMTWNNYQIVFAISAFLRIICIFLAMRVDDPKSSSPIHLLNDIRCSWPLRLVRLPVGLYRKK